MPIDQEDKDVTPKGYCGYCDIADKMGRRPNPCEQSLQSTVEKCTDPNTLYTCVCAS